MWIRLNGGEYSGQLIDVSKLFRISINTNGTQWRVVGFLPDSTEEHQLTDIYTSEEDAEAAFINIRAGVTPPVP